MLFKLKTLINWIWFQCLAIYYREKFVRRIVRHDIRRVEQSTHDKKLLHLCKQIGCCARIQVIRRFFQCSLARGQAH